MKLFEGLEISPENQTAITATVEKLLADANASANINANGILDGAMKVVIEKTGIERLSTETKASDYFIRAAETVKENALTNAGTVLSDKETKISELQAKIDAGLTDESFKAEYAELKIKFGELSQTLESEKKRIESIETDYNSKLSSYQQSAAIKTSMPEIDKSVNKYEKDARIKEAEAKLKSDYKLELSEDGILHGTKDFLTRPATEILTGMLKDIAPNNVEGGGGVPPVFPPKELTIPAGTGIVEKVKLIESFLLNIYESKAAPGYAEHFHKLNV